MSQGSPEKKVDQENLAWDLPLCHAHRVQELWNPKRIKAAMTGKVRLPETDKRKREICVGLVDGSLQICEFPPRALVYP